MKKKNNKKLLIQISLITVSILTVSLVFFVFFDFHYSKSVYLSSKEEMINISLRSLSDSISKMTEIKPLLGYVENHHEELSVPISDEEKKLYESDAYMNVLAKFITEPDFDFDGQTPEIQLFLARRMLSLVEVQFIFLSGTDYEKAELMKITDEHSAFLIAEYDIGNGEDKNSDTVNTDAKNVVATIPYEASEHSAVREILNGKLDNREQTVFEEYYDPESEKYLYNGYIAVMLDGQPAFDLCLQYDLTDFRGNLTGRIITSFLTRLAVLVVLNALLMLFINLKAVSPLAKVKRGVQKYRDDKDTAAVVDLMNGIRARNEVGVLAESISDMATEIDNYISIAAENERIETELALATDIQLSALPSSFPAFPEHAEFDIYASMKPAKEVGGDFYDFFLVDEDHLAIVMADVSGKGVPAALFMMMSKMLVQNYTMMGHGPKSMLELVNRQICSNNQSKMFVTVYIGILDLNTGEMICGNAGHEYPVLKKPDGHFEVYHDHHNFVVGGYAALQYDEYMLKLDPGSKLFLYTDGLPDATNEDKTRFGVERAVEELRTVEDKTPKEILETVTDRVQAFVGDAPQFDDLTMLCIHFKGKETE